jgi:HlyD family secretion protein
VQRVEPSAFTRVSALGVEEQRVNVIVERADPPEAWAALGDGYQLEARIVVWEGERVLQVPASAIFRAGEGWAVFVAAHGRAQRRAVQVGHQNGQQAEILRGLSIGERVIVHPSDQVRDGVRVRAR